MIVHLAATIVFACALVWWAVPRVTLLADRRLARRRLPAGLAPDTTTPRPRGASDARPAPAATVIELASLCDALARAVRSGRSAAEALGDALDRLPSRSPVLGAMRADLDGTRPLTAVLAAAQRDAPAGSDEGLFIDLLCASVVGSSMIAGGVEHASATLRDVAAMRADLDVASAQARLSARVLSLLPVVVVLGGLLASGSFRSSLTAPGVLVPLIIGLALTRVGWSWIVRMLDSVVAGATRFELAEIVDRICVSLMAGCPLSEACERIGDRRVDPASSGAAVSASLAIATRIREGRSLGEALEPLSTAFGLSGRLFADLLVAAERDGLPVVASVSRVAQDVRMERRRRVDAAIRRIPVRLTMPLVLCILPGFLLATLVPLVAASLDTLTVTLPNLISPLGP